MTFDREEYRRFLKSREQKQQAQNARLSLEQLMQAEVKMENLTGDGNWDLFLQYIQAAKDKLTERRRSAIDLLASIGVSDIKEVMHYKLLVAELTGRLLALEAIVSLPAEIQKSGEQAKGLLERMGDL